MSPVLPPITPPADGFEGDGFGGEILPCWLRMPMTGAVSQMVQATGCGYKTTAGQWILRWWLTDGNKPVITVYLTFPVYLAQGQTGSFVLNGFAVETDPNDMVEGDESTWSAAAGVCGVEIWENRTLRADGRYDVRLSGVCAAPVGAESGPIGGTVTVAPFHGTFYMP